MKIYLYDIETGIYQGEDCSDEAFLEGEPVLVPAGATTVAPPTYGKGAVPVFDEKRNSWVINWVPVGDLVERRGRAPAEPGPAGHPTTGQVPAEPVTAGSEH